MGVYGLRSENILLKAVCTVVNRSEKRRFSCAADAFHFTNCRGLIELDGCNCNGQGDDALNIHGIYARIVAVLKDRKQIELFESGSRQNGCSKPMMRSGRLYERPDLGGPEPH